MYYPFHHQCELKTFSLVFAVHMPHFSITHDNGFARELSTAAFVGGIQYPDSGKWTFFT
jgi:hypothetical protein